MAHSCALRDAQPVALSVLKQATDFGVERFHAPSLVKDSLESKEHITKTVGHPRPVAEKPLPINEVVAQNLAYWMGQWDDGKGISQAALAERAHVSQKTISNYLNPSQRDTGAMGKPPSAKLAELDAIANALHISVWQLTRQMTQSERMMYEAIETAYINLRASVQNPGKVTVELGKPVAVQPKPMQDNRKPSKGKGQSALEKAVVPSLGSEPYGSGNKNQRTARAKGGRRA